MQQVDVTCGLRTSPTSKSIGRAGRPYNNLALKALKGPSTAYELVLEFTQNVTIKNKMKTSQIITRMRGEIVPVTPSKPIGQAGRSYNN